jgi:pyridoxine 5-phosphate synthase
MKRKRLGVNIDHVATIRNARGESYPEPIRAAIKVQKSGADSVTIHLREDRRHIIDLDLKLINKNLNIPLNLEIAPTKEMLKIAIKYKPNYVCIVPEKRQEITTEGGLNIKKNFNFLKKMTNKLQKNKIRVSFFIEPNISDIKLSNSLGVNCVELHTGKFCRLKNKRYSFELNKLQKAAKFADSLGLEVHAGHGLDYRTTKLLSKINEISEFNIGHFIISESIFLGLKKTINNFKRIIKNNN